MASPRFDVYGGSYESHLRRQQEFNRRAAAQREKPRNIGEVLRCDRYEIIYLPGPKPRKNAVGIPLISAEEKHG